MADELLAKAKQMLSIVTINTMCTIPEPIRFNGMGPRATRFADAFYGTLGEDIDIVCMQELTWHRNDIIKKFVKHKYVTPVMKSSLFGSNVRITDSGLCVLSKYPIQNIYAMIFDGPSYHVERLCAKGALLVRCFIPNLGYVNIVNTHLNAWTGLKADRAREHQVNQIHNWIHSLEIDSTEPLFFAGDYNIDAYEHSDTMFAIMNTLEAYFPYPNQTSFSFDPATNPLVGSDDPSEYATISKKGGCLDEYLTLGSCSCCPKQLVDGIAISKINFQPTEWKTEVVAIKTSAKFKIKIKLGVDRLINNVSDHNAVVLRLHFPNRIIPSIDFSIEGKHCTKISYDQPRFDHKWFLIQVLLTILYFLIFLAILYCCKVI